MIPRRRTRRAWRTLLLVLFLITLPGSPALAAGDIASPSPSLPDPAASLPTTTPVKHLITIMQSNHSFDSLFGVYPGADGIPAGACMPADPEATDGPCVTPFPITNNGADFDHTHTTFKNQYRDGLNNGFIYSFRQRGEDGTLAMGYYTETEIPFSYEAASEYVLFDRFFTSASAGSVPNRMFWTTGTAGVEDLSRTAMPMQGWGDLPTIFDLLDQQGISWKLYVENYDPSLTFRDLRSGSTYAQVNWVPLLGFARFVDNPDLSSHIVDLEDYFTDLQTNALPAVSYVVTIGSSGHPPSSLNASERMLRRMTNALMLSQAWDTSVLQWAYDDWGGWYDHVPPPQVDEFGYGFRTAAQLISPYARQGYVDSETHDFTSILRFIEDNWSLPSLSTRDANAISIATALDFAQAPRTASIIPMDREEIVLVIPKRAGIYATYSTAILFSAAVIIVALGWDRRKKKGARP
jgi:phospholipase C